MSWKMSTATLLCAASMVVIGCDDGDGGGDAADMGRGGEQSALYSGPESAALGAAANQARCSTCHSIDGTENAYPGNSLMDIAYRSSFKGGGAPDLISATNACVTGWMGGEALTAEDPEWVELEAFLQSISDPAITEPNGLMPEVLADEAAYEAAYADAGDAERGAALYERACGTCHTPELVVGDRTSFSLTVLAAFSAGRLAQKVRTSGPPPSGMLDAEDNTPGPMPFFEMRDLSAAELADIIAYIKSQG